jgi:hypothetical protein
MAPSRSDRPALTIGVLLGGGSRDDVSRQLASLGRLEWYESGAALFARAEAWPLDAVVTALRDEHGCSVASTVIELVARRPAMPLVLYTRIDHAALDALAAVFTLGLRMECAVRPHARLDQVLERMLSPAYRPGVAPLLMHHFMPSVPFPLRTFVALAILEATWRRGVDELARWSQVSARTIERRFRSAGWPAAHVVVQSFAALDAVWLMSEYRWSARRVSEVRGFSHPSGVTRLLSTYAGTRPGTVLDDGGFAAALEHVTRVLLPETQR